MDKIDVTLRKLNEAESLEEMRVVLREFAFRAFAAGQESERGVPTPPSIMESMVAKMHEGDPRNK